MKSFIIAVAVVGVACGYSPAGWGHFDTHPAGPWLQLPGYGVSHFYVGAGGPDHPDPAMAAMQPHALDIHWNFTAAQWNNETDRRPCDCIPGYHEALDVSCTVSGNNTLHVSHPEMQFRCSGPGITADEIRSPDRCHALPNPRRCQHHVGG